MSLRSGHVSRGSRRALFSTLGRELVRRCGAGGATSQRRCNRRVYESARADRPPLRRSLRTRSSEVATTRPLNLVARRLEALHQGSEGASRSLDPAAIGLLPQFERADVRVEEAFRLLDLSVYDQLGEPPEGSDLLVIPRRRPRARARAAVRGRPARPQTPGRHRHRRRTRSRPGRRCR
jgi:hypothetical protein